MSALPEYADTFVGARAFEALYETVKGKRTLLLELRTRADGSVSLFTEIDGRPVRAHGIWDFVARQPRLKSLAIPHDIKVQWDGAPKSARLRECVPLLRGLASLPGRYARGTRARRGEEGAGAGGGMTIPAGSATALTSRAAPAVGVLPIQLSSFAVRNYTSAS